MHRLILSLVLLLGGAMPLTAQTPEDTVRWIYASLTQPGPNGLHYLSAADRRDQFFTRRMVAFYAANDSQGGTCVDFGFAVPGNDYDAAEIQRSLALETSGGDSQKSISARFTSFGRPAQVVYDFTIEDGFWKIDDIAGPGWRVSQITCAPQAAAPASAGYCYIRGDDSLRLDLTADGGAMIDLQSWQANGHSCSATGRAEATDGGWLFQAEEGCRLQILVTAEQGLRLADPDWACKRWLCGQRAVIDGLNFPRSSQVDCSQMPRY
jgi:hypothetical protein